MWGVRFVCREAIPKGWSPEVLEPILHEQGFKKETQWGEFATAFGHVCAPTR